MTVIQTDEWLLESWDDPYRLCERLIPYFQDASAQDIYHHLTMHGMYADSLEHGSEAIEHMQQKQLWKIVREEELALKKLWKGPNVPIFIFPADEHNRKLQQQFNGKAGLAFKDKLFLFISAMHDYDDIKALLAHEYNHICRLTKYQKKEHEYVLLDTIILEGLAEYAVLERLGEQHIATWTSYYNDKQLEELWQRLIRPSWNLPKHHKKHHDLLYGMGFFPNMIGYAVGFYLVKKFLRQNKHSIDTLFDLPSKKFANIENDF